MIILGKPFLKETSSSTSLVTEIEIDGKKNSIIVSVDKKYGEFLCHERNDALLVGLLSHALRNGHDIECKAPITENLLYNINEVLLPTLINTDPSNHSVKIYCDTAPCLPSAGAVGTGISCGVDSFHTIAKHYNTPYEAYRLTHLTIYNIGAFGDTLLNAQQRQTKQDIFKKALSVAEELGLPLIQLDSNIHEVIHQNHEFTCAYTTMFAILSLQKLWGIYYYASSNSFAKFSLKNNLSHGSGYFELLLLSCFSLPSLKLYSTGGEGERIDKLKVLINFPLAQKKLRVCTSTTDNCGLCSKCKRTLLDLDALNALEYFEESFNINYYKNNTLKYYIHLCKKYVYKDDFSIESYRILSKRHKLLFFTFTLVYSLKYKAKQLRRSSKCILRNIKNKF